MVRVKDIWGRGFPPSNTFIIVTAVIICCLLLVPNGIEPRLQRYVNMHMAGILCIGLYALRINVWAGVLLIYTAFMCLFGISIPFAVQIMVCGVVFCFVAEGKVSKEALYNTICIIALFNAVWVFMQVCGVFIVTQPVSGTYKAGLMANRCDEAALLAMCLPFFFRRKWVWGLIIIIPALVAVESHGGILAAAIVTGAYATIAMKKYWIVALCMVGLVIFFGFVRPIFPLQSLKSEYRTAWAEAVDVWQTKPFGWGIGQFRYVFPLVTAFPSFNKDEAGSWIAQVSDKEALKRHIEKKKAVDPAYFTKSVLDVKFLELHQEYIEWLFNMGFIGFFLLIGGLSRQLWRGFKKRSLSAYGLLAVSLSALWFFPWHLITTALLTAVCIADIEGDYYGGSVSTNSK